jgi:NadR type nicotinamide-nucleotide adenylyltransferase
MDQAGAGPGERARTGLLLGKFLPLTRGHCHLIETALAQVEHLTVLVCSLRADPIDGHRRYLWVKEMFPTANIIHVTEELPSYPDEHPDFWDIWRDVCLRHSPQIDLIFTSEDYGDRLAEVVGARHVLVDQARTTVPISGTKVRADPLRHWEYLPEVVRPYYVRRILLYGPESTGKTTLARQLAEHYRTEWVPEFARGYLDAEAAPCLYDDISHIAAGQQEAEETTARRADRLLFCDTDAITTTIYAHHFFGRCPLWVQRLADERRYDLVLFCDIDLPWMPDPLHRDSPHRREEFRDRFLNELHSRRISCVTIRGTGDSRLQAAVSAVEEYLRRYQDGIVAGDA